MNKTIIININGTVFHIEEDAYEILKNYMTDVKRHFMNSADSLEITTDIENRIAEMFTEILLREGKQVIVEQDVKSVVEQMGSVADFESAEEDGKTGFSNNFNYSAESRRLFRDPDDRLVAGVCSGIANYFDINPVWIRLAFALSCAIAGTGIMVYIILWIVVPKAVTRADRMAMKGQKLNLQGFKTNFEQEMGSLHGHFSEFQKEARPFIYKTRDFAGDFFQHLGTFLGGTGKVFAKLFGIAVLVVCFGFIIALIVGIIALLAYGNMGIYHIFPFNIVSHQINTIFIICAFLMLSIPLLAIILTIISAVFNSTGMTRSSGTTMLMVWIVALSMVIYYTAKVSADFRSSAGFSQTINIAPSADSTYHLKLNDIKYLSAADSVRLKISDKFNGKIILDDDDDDNMDSPGNISIDIEKSDVAGPVLVEAFSARGRNYDDALFNARSATYLFTQQGSDLKFSRRLQKPDDMLWRAQDLHLTLKVPLNYKIVVDEDVDRYVRGVSVYDCKTINKNGGASSATFIMTNNGLQCKVDTLVLPQSVLPGKTDSTTTDSAAE
ncbi:PspC domain-containing protein [Mucilaginibacter segetis]|uniref:PspC domain-containing protein n=1 Tax=Mucilaginibacter segetis TaxID=2793071 RepID=A0A934PV17_9SPHI|nr:PspC domain-containing protein [Mucilaginibacter segetis]MBK0379920.1 PspC domain-containing protein [Mucilaginibacter segetis]